MVLFHSAEAWLIMASIYGRLLLLGAVRLPFTWDFLGVLVSMTPGGRIDVLLLFFSLFVSLPSILATTILLLRAPTLGSGVQDQLFVRSSCFRAFALFVSPICLPDSPLHVRFGGGEFAFAHGSKRLVSCLPSPRVEFFLDLDCGGVNDTRGDFLPMKTREMFLKNGWLLAMLSSVRVSSL